MIYSPSDDSFLLADEVKKHIFNILGKGKNKLKVLDMGSGSGIQALSAIESGIKKTNILCADIDNEAVKFLKRLKLKTIKTNLFSNIKKSDKFSLIIFNAPYLPESKYDNQADTTAGKKGYEIIIEFLKQAKSHLAKKGAILLLFSSLSKPKIILKEAKSLKYNFKILAKKSVGFFEKLFVYKIKN